MARHPDWRESGSRLRGPNATCPLAAHGPGVSFSSCMDALPASLTTALSGRYEFQGALGAGGMARVYLANDLRHGRKVAIKVVRDDIAAAMGTERFLNEIRTTAALQHPHILPLLDSGEADGHLFYVMPFVAG
jgi:serine/threonine protein kinase